MGGSKLTNFVSALSGGKAADVSVLEMDAAAQEVCEEYVDTWIKSRIRHNLAQKRPVKDDAVYVSVVEFVTAIGTAFFYPRLWTEAGIKQQIWESMQAKQERLEFVYRGASLLHAKVFGSKANDTQNVGFQTLVKHLCDSLCIMSSTDSSLVTQEVREVFPTYNTLQQMFTENPWLTFIYYIGRIDMFELIEKGTSS
ncbi:hypothetical protein ACSA002_1450 [Salmonella phage vB_SalM_SA002]|nr:hypothetical protein ACSA002_1450 [Salmonella phage vB_SalM_SA002]